MSHSKEVLLAKTALACVRKDKHCTFLTTCLLMICATLNSQKQTNALPSYLELAALTQYCFV